MKNRINKIALFILTVALLQASASCKKSFFSDVNKNPNAPDSNNIIPSVLLPTVEASLAYSVGGESARYAGLLTQQVFGYAAQAQAYYSYTFTTNDFEALWDNYYTSVLENDLKLQQMCDARGYNRYGGIARILTAYTLQVLVDSWGSIPYSKALMGDANLKPTYDTDQGLYDTIQNLLTRSIALLNDPSPGVLVPGKDDFIYGGSAAEWIKFAHAIKARLYIHQSKGNVTMANNALSEVALSFTSNADNAQFYFTNVETASNPMYQFNQQRGYLDYHSGQFLDSMMDTNGDPRYSAYIDSTYEDVNQVGAGPYYGNANSPVELLSLDELLFIKAEATLRSGGGLIAAQTYLRQAIDTNMAKLGVDPGDALIYTTTRALLSGSVSNAIAHVAEEEYVALFLNPEVWTLWRRTGSPNIPSQTSGSIPRRFLYPQSEYSTNGANTPASTLLSPKIFWDN